jgi:hypothetical protein
MNHFIWHWDFFIEYFIMHLCSYAIMQNPLPGLRQGPPYQGERMDLPTAVSRLWSAVSGRFFLILVFTRTETP